MFSIPQQPSSGLVFFNLVLLFAVYLLQKRALKFPFTVPKSSTVISIILMFVFVLFSFWGQDWFHYLEAYPDLCLGERGHMEVVYVWIAQHLSFDYISFRFAVWGTGLILLLLTIERLPLKRDLIILFFGSIWIIWFSYARVSLGLALAFWGLAVFYNPYRNKFLSKIIAITAISVSFVFHKSLFIVVFAIVLTLLSLSVGRRLFIIVAIMSVPLIILYIRGNITYFFMLDADANGNSMDQSIYFGQYYLESSAGSSRSRGIGELLATVIGAVPYYLLLIQSIILTYKHENYINFKVVQSFIHLFIILILIATLFTLNIGVNSSILYVRILRFASFPCALLLAYYWENQFYPKLTKWTLSMAILSTLYSVCYSLYLYL